MRRPLIFPCEGAWLAGMAHPAGGEVGVVIVTGGVQTRAGAHRGFVRLADRLAAAGYPILRFDRRGVGDSDGEDPGFRDSAPDIAAAIAAFRRAFPAVRRVVGWGLCDGAAALAIHADRLDLGGLVLVNPWTRDETGPAALPPRSVVARRYRLRLLSPDAWGRLLRGDIDVLKAARGLRSLFRRERSPDLAGSIASGLRAANVPCLVVLAAQDATAQAFATLWNGDPAFRPLRERLSTETITIPGATHTFATAETADALEERLLAWLAAFN